MDVTSAWNFFTYVREKGVGICNKCGRPIKPVGRSTSGLISHLKSQHGIHILKRKINEEITCEVVESTAKSNKPKEKITDFLEKKVDDSLPAIIARMTAKDGFPFNKFCT